MKNSDQNFNPPDINDKNWEDREKPTGTISEDQIERIKAYKDILEDALEDFRRDGDVETEIRIWEAISRVFGKKIILRSDPGLSERKLLLSVLLHCSMFGTTNLHSIFPPAKTLPDVERVLKAWDRETV